MKVNRYEYYFSIYGVEYEVYPINDIVISGKTFEDDRTCVAYRKSIDTVTISKDAKKPTIAGFVDEQSKEVYAALVDIWADQDKWSDRFYFIVRDTCCDKKDASFVFNVLDCKFDFDSGTLEIGFVDRDEYFAIDEYGDEDVDFFNVREYGYSYAERSDVSMHVKPIDREDLEFYCQYDQENWNYDLGATYSKIVWITDELGNTAIVESLAICVSKIKPPFAEGWQFDELEERWFCDPGDVNNGFVSGFTSFGVNIPVGTIDVNSYIVDYAKTLGVNNVVKWLYYDMPLSFRRFAVVFGYDTLTSRNVVMDNALTFEQGMNAVAERLGYTVDAQYAALFTAQHPVIMQKSDFKRYEVSNNATKFKMSFNDMMNTLKAVTNLLWWVDDNVLYLRPPWWTEQYYPSYDKTDLKIVNVFDINYENIPYKERWTFMEQGTRLFDEDTCIYNLSLKAVADDNETDYSADRCTVDLYYIFYNIDEIDDDGMVLLACNKTGDKKYKVRYAPIAIGDTEYPNGDFSTRNIQDKRYCYNRPLKKYFYDADGDDPMYAKSTLSLIELKFQVPFQLVDDESFNPQRKMKITLYSEKQGKNIEVEGYVKSYSFNTKTRRVDAIIRTELIS